MAVSQTNSWNATVTAPCKSLTLIAISVAALVVFGLFVWLQDRCEA
jgi:hypothetical protein